MARRLVNPLPGWPHRIDKVSWLTLRTCMSLLLEEGNRNETALPRRLIQQVTPLLANQLAAATLIVPAMHALSTIWHTHTRIHHEQTVQERSSA